MAGPIRIKREGPIYRVLKTGEPVAEIRQSLEDEFGHNPEEPWLLEYRSGRIERYGYRDEAVDAAHKL